MYPQPIDNSGNHKKIAIVEMKMIFCFVLLLPKVCVFS